MIIFLNTKCNSEYKFCHQMFKKHFSATKNHELGLKNMNLETKYLLSFCISFLLGKYVFNLVTASIFSRQEGGLEVYFFLK